MKTRALFSFFALVALLACASAAPAQSASPDQSAKRQVKSKVDPAYPALAREMHVNGKVKIEVNVAADGSVRNTKVLGGSPLLVRAALDAVKGWKYEPATNESTETVEFVFNNF
jgi:TonB family protein